MTSPASTEPAIVVDGVFFQLNRTGIARVWKEILTRWQDRDIGRRIVVIDRDGSLPQFTNLRRVAAPPLDYKHWPQDRVSMQNICDSVGAGLFISTYYTRPERTRSFLFIHDMIPERIGYDLRDPMWQQKHDAIRHAAAFAANSKHTLSDLWALVPETRGKPAGVTYPGVSPELSPSSPDEQQAFHERFVGPYLSGRPYFLFVSDHWPYKNANLLYQSLGSLPRSMLDSVGLLLTQKELLERFRSLPGLSVHAQWLSDADLRLAYGSAIALIYPSLYEGFGLPALEAMACGCPVVCTNRTSLPEVVGDAALITHPFDHNILRNNLLSLQKPDVPQEFRRRGLERATHFSWDKMASELAGLVTNCVTTTDGR